MANIPFNENELEVKNVVTSRRGTVRTYNTPITNRENYKAFFKGEPVWQVAGRTGVKGFCPCVIPDNISRGFVSSGEGFDNQANGGGPDMFGIEWVYVPQVGGSMVRPGSPTLKNANDWKEVIKFPDIDSWDWAGSAKANAEYLNTDDAVQVTLLTGAWFERLISFMDFEGAAMALIDEDQQDAVKELFAATTDLLCRIVDKIAEYFPQVDSISVHDDWGSQAQPFFSEDAAEEMIVPFMKKLSDHIKSKGIIAELHSCGHTESRINCYIHAGWQSWGPQPMNDADKLYEEYGDQIVISVTRSLPDDLSEEQQKEEARKFVESNCVLGKLCKVSYNTNLEAYEKELYKLSRKKFLGE